MKKVWNDTDIPLAYLITFRTYGTWLHGDKRGSVNRFNNGYGSPKVAPNKNWENYNRQELSGESVVLNAKQRNAVEWAIREVCEYRKWILRAINVRTNHVHAVVSIGPAKPEKVLNDFKSYATRRLRAEDLLKSERSPWVDKGSKRYLWNENSIYLACDYVINGQGGELPDFD